MTTNNLDFIYCKKNALSKEKCDSIIDLFNRDTGVVQGMVGSNHHFIMENDTPNPLIVERGKIDNKWKKCTEVFVPVESVNPYNPLFLEELGQATVEYKEQYPFINEVSHWTIWEKYKIQKYLPNEAYFGLHCENTGPGPSTVNNILVWMIYLNDVTDDGYTEFPTQGKLLQPRTGDIIIWPAYWTHPHRGIPSKTQTKYIMTGWWGWANPYQR